MATTTNFNWSTPDDSSAVKDGASAIRSLGTAVDTTMATMIPKSAITAKGDLIVGTASGTYIARGVGANGTVLTANSAQADGVEWAAPSSGGMTSIASGSVASGGIDLSSISSSYNDLVLIIRGISTSGGTAQIRVRFNNDSAGNYTWKQWRASTLSNNFGTNEITVTDSWNTDSTTNNYIHIYLTDYANTSSLKYLESVTSGGYWGTANFANTVGQWNNTSAINRIQVLPSTGSFDAGTYILYGVK